MNRTGQRGEQLPADIAGVSMPRHPLTVPSKAEMGLIYAAKYETDLHVEAAQARRRFHGVGALLAVATLVFAYDVLSLIFGG